MYQVRRWCVRHSGLLEKCYRLIEKAVLGLTPIWQRLGYHRLEAPFAFAERHAKGLLFDCKMCGQCALSSTGMSCPMNCPKNIRNGPCGGVRSNGNCEVEPDMQCVWVAAWNGSARMENGSAIQNLQQPIDFTRMNKSAWLNIVRRHEQDRAMDRAG